ncbi:MAG: hypothetical protein HY315_09620 [Acidobacteria bacterium]|nr:hypothetical protein [Acidobacteriota bacterium]
MLGHSSIRVTVDMYFDWLPESGGIDVDVADSGNQSVRANWKNRQQNGNYEKTKGGDARNLLRKK